MATGKELVPYSAPESYGRQIKGYARKVVKKMPGEYKFLGKVAKGVGKVAKAAVKHPITTAAIAGAAYAFGSKDRRYAKAPKVGENRDLNSRLIRRGI